MVLGRRAGAEQRGLDHLVAVDRMAHRLAHALVLELFDIGVHAGDDRLGGLDLVHGDMRERLHRIDLHRIGFRQAIHLLGGHRGDTGTGIVAEVDELEAVEVRTVAPIVAARLVFGILADGEFDELERAGAVAPGPNLPFSSGSRMNIG